MRIFIPIVIFLLNIPTVANAQLQATAYVFLGPKNSVTSTSKVVTLETVRVFIVLKNTGTPPIRVVTGGKIQLGSSVPNSHRSSCELFFERKQQTSIRGEIVVYADSELGIATLRQGECAQIEQEVKVPFPIEAENIKVVYKIDKTIGERHKTWSGEIQVRAIRLPL